MRWVIFTIIDVVVLLSSCLFTSGLCVFIVREYDEYAALTPYLTVDRSVRICGAKATPSMNMTIAFLDPFREMCALGEVFNIERLACNIEYSFYDSYNPVLVNHAFRPESSLLMHACGRRLEALQAHALDERGETALGYAMIRSDATLAASVEATMLQRLTGAQLRTNLLQKLVYRCNQERELGTEHLRQTMLEARNSLLQTTDALKAMAELSRRGCPSVAHVGVGMRGDGYVAVLQERPLPLIEEVRRVYEALQLPFDEAGYAQVTARLQTPVDEPTSPVVREYIQQFVSLQQTTSETSIPLHRMEIGEAKALRTYIEHYVLGARDANPSSLVEALSTVCVYSIVAGGYAHEWDVGLVVESLRQHAMQGGMHRTRRQSVDLQRRFGPPAHNEFVHATTPNVLSIVDEEVHDCVHTVRHFFVDAYESLIFQMLVPPTLEQRIHRLFAQLQAEMQTVLGYETIRNLFHGDVGPVRWLVQRASLRLVGDQPPDARHVIPHETILAMLHQAGHATSERLRRVHASGDPCSMAPLFGGVTTNAYFLYPFGCVVVGAGILVRPFADESYSDTALLMGIGFVMAHELGHALLAGTIDPSRQARLLHAYPSSTYEEAVADLLGALTVLRLHGDREDMCVRLQQIWCVYVDERSPLEAEPSHPYPHKRWEDLCALLRNEKY